LARPNDIAKRTILEGELERARAEFKARFPNFGQRRAEQQQWVTAVAAAKDITNPLHAWALLRQKSGTEFVNGWQQFTKQLEDEIASRHNFNRANFKSAWKLALHDDAQWFKSGINYPNRVPRAGEVCVQPEGEHIVSGIYPAGVYSHLLSQKYNGILTSPRFKVENDYLSVHALGGKGARVRLVIENYPLGTESIYPQAELKNDAPGWIRMDTAYRKGSQAYLEFVTASDNVSRSRSAPGNGGRSYFGADTVVFHSTNAPPREESLPSQYLLHGDPPKSADELAFRYARLLATAVSDWRAGHLSEQQRSFLDFFVRSDLLPNSTNLVKKVAPLVAAYRALESEVPVARRSPGLLETVGYDAPLLTRGDHTKPSEAVHRRYLEVLASKAYSTKLSGRLELANEIASPDNPLTSRVMVNRVWQHLFGRGIVATVDNFGRLGEQPSHPELLDYLAADFVDHGWSFKEMIRFLVTSRAYQMSSETSAQAREVDPANQLLSHMPVRRLEAELIRDSLLATAGRLDNTMFGPSVDALAAPADQRRRSIYLSVRRNSLSPFLQAFDAPKPFTTLGRREPTNVPAQSLALLNDPFVIEVSGAWAQALNGSADLETRVRQMFERALSRPPTESELISSRAYLIAEGNDLKAVLDNHNVWRDFAQSLFNLKEFIYIK
jgi:hypothetical protein